MLTPLAAAHAEHDRPSIQADQEVRTVRAALAGANATVELLKASDAVSDYVRHTLDLRRGVIAVEERPQASRADDAFSARFTLLRLVEYRDANRDGAYSPGADLVARSWTPSQYAWNATGPQSVRVADVQAQFLRWQANATGSPAIRVDAVAAGRAFTDEGARARPQDVVLYVDFTNLPVRAAGHLHAIEGLVQTSPGASVRLDRGPNLTAGLVVEAPHRLAFLDWGAEGVVDGKEQRLAADLREPKPDGSVEFVLHLPIMDESLRLVMVSGVEYEKEERRADGVGLAVTLATVVLLAVWTRRR